MSIYHGVKLRGTAALTGHVQKWHAGIEAAYRQVTGDGPRTLILELGKADGRMPVIWLLHFEQSQVYLGLVPRPGDEHPEEELHGLVVSMLQRVNGQHQGIRCDSCGADYGDREPPPVCVICDHRRITPCPACRRDFSAAAYRHLAGQILRCPGCNAKVVFYVVPAQETDEGIIQSYTAVLPVTPAGA